MAKKRQSKIMVDSITKEVIGLVTPEIGLQKPLRTDYYDIEVHNKNMDLIDEYLKEFKILNSNAQYEIIVTSDMWVTEQEAKKLTISHNLETKKLFVVTLDKNTFEPLFLSYKLPTINEITFEQSEAQEFVLIIISPIPKTIESNGIIDDTYNTIHKTFSSKKIVTELNKKANTEHTHSMNDINGLILNADNVRYNKNKTTHVASALDKLFQSDLDNKTSILQQEKDISAIQKELGINKETLIANTIEIFNLY